MLFLTTTPLAGMPWRTMKVCNRFLEPEGGWAKSLCYSPKAYQSREYPQGLIAGDSEAERAFEEADIVLLTAYMGDEHARGKPFARHYSTEPFRWVEQKPNKSNSTVVAQYQARFAEWLDVLPNAIPIDDPMFIPAEKSEDKINIVYTPTSRTAEGWANKGFQQTMLAFRRILNDEEYRDRVNIYLLENQNYDVVMAARRHAHIVIDECATGSYHSTTLEGLSCGAATLVWIDPDTQHAINKLFGKETSLPVFNVHEREIFPTLVSLIENPFLLKSAMKESRNWMLTNYSEQWQAEMWIQWHRNFLKSSETLLTP